MENVDVELGYGMDTRVNRVATFVDGVIFTAASGQLREADHLLKEIEEVSGLTKRILLARAAIDLDNGDGRIVLQVFEGDGKKFVTADEFSLSGNEEGELPTVFVAGMFVDANSSIFEESDKRPLVSEEALSLIINGVTTTQARIEADPKRFMTRSECQRIMGK